jgi:cytochrome c
MKSQFWTQSLGVGAAVAVMSVACASRMSQALGAQSTGAAERSLAADSTVRSELAVIVAGAVAGDHATTAGVAAAVGRDRAGTVGAAAGVAGAGGDRDGTAGAGAAGVAAVGGDRAGTAGGSAVAGDAVHGQALYQACAACHSIDENDIGPKHRGVVGRPAGSVEGYGYSAALKQSGLTWDVGTLDRWLTNPSALVPGTKMFFKIDAARDRADLIAYLQQQK